MALLSWGGLKLASSPESSWSSIPEERGSRPSRETKYALVSEKQP
ncbi:hypothetical protein Tco_0701752, partial [Tanacetum coccineum]